MTFSVFRHHAPVIFALTMGGLLACDRSSSGSTRSFVFPNDYVARAESLRAGDSVADVAPELRQGMMLSIEPDSLIATYFMAHAATFDSIAALFHKRAQLSTIDVLTEPAPERRDGAVVPTNRNTQLHALLRSAGATAVFRDERYPDCVFVRLGGPGRMHLGYLYVPKDVAAPVARGTLAAVTPIHNGWYLYKTR